MDQTEFPQMYVPVPVVPMRLITTEALVLQARVIRLEPLTMAFLNRFCEIGLEDEIWRYFPIPIHTAADMQRYIEIALNAQQTGAALPFAIVDQATGWAVGSTRYMSIDRENWRVEIGSTWLGRAWQRTAVNTEAKYLLLRYAFEVFGCVRVELKTDVLNTRSQQAILRLGAKQEGILRNHLILANGRVRHSVYFSVIRQGWPEVKRHLEQTLNARY